MRLRSDGRDVKRVAKARGLCQADELIHVAEVPVFLLDDWQSLRPKEVGTVDYLVERAKACGCDYEVIELPGMFRAEGSIAFREWVTKLLSLKPTTAPPGSLTGASTCDSQRVRRRWRHFSRNASARTTYRPV